MITKKEELLSTLAKVKDLPVLVVGDIILDRYIWGGTERISPEAPVPIVKVSKTEDRLGGAGNVVRNLTNLGAKVSVCGFVGDDDEGQIVLDLLEQGHVQRDGVLVERGKPTALKTRVVAMSHQAVRMNSQEKVGRSQQVVRIDREERLGQSAALREGFAAVVDAQLDANKAVILSDYGKGSISSALLTKLGEAQDTKRLSLELRPLVLDPHPANYEIYSRVSVAKPNRREAELGSGISINDRESALRAGQILLKKWAAEVILITLGEDGLLILSADGSPALFRDTVAREVFDVSGAGDTVTAVYSAAIAAGAKPIVAGDLANIAAGVVVSEVGTVPIRHDRLVQEIERISKAGVSK